MFAFDRCEKRAAVLSKMLKKFGVENALVQVEDFLKVDMSDRRYKKVTRM